MKVSKIIRLLNSVIDEHGDIDCWIEDSEGCEYSVTDIACVIDDTEKYVLFTPYKIRYPLTAVK